MTDYVISLIRTWVPILVGGVATWLAAKTGVILDEQSQAGLIVGFGGLLSAIYYGAVRWLETRYPALGVLLGKRQQPEYKAPRST